MSILSRAIQQIGGFVSYSTTYTGGTTATFPIPNGAKFCKIECSSGGETAGGTAGGGGGNWARYSALNVTALSALYVVAGGANTASTVRENTAGGTIRCKAAPRGFGGDAYDGLGGSFYLGGLGSPTGGTGGGGASSAGAGSDATVGTGGYGPGGTGANAGGSPTGNGGGGAPAGAGGAGKIVLTWS